MVDLSQDLSEQFRRRLLSAVERTGRKVVTRADGERRGREDRHSISQGGLTKILNGERPNPGIFTVKAIADAAGVTVGQLLGEEPGAHLDLSTSESQLLAKIATLRPGERVRIEELLHLFTQVIASTNGTPRIDSETAAEPATNRANAPYTPRPRQTDELRGR